MKVNKFQRGQIWWYEDCNTFDSSVQGKTRPVIIISNNKANENSNNVTVIPCTTKIKRLDMKTHILFSLNNINNITLCESILTANKAKLHNYEGVCDNELMEKIEDGVKIALGLSSEPICDDEVKQPAPEIQVIPIIPESTYTNETIDIKQPEEKTSKRGRKTSITIDDKIRFINDYENHDTDFMLKKYNLSNKKALAQKAYLYRKDIKEIN